MSLQIKTVIENFPIDRIAELTRVEVLKSKGWLVTEDKLIRCCGEELGELCLAVSVERGLKQRELDEPAKVEALDLALCALSFYFVNAGRRRSLLGC